MDLPPANPPPPPPAPDAAPARALRYRTLTWLWFFPSAGALWIVARDTAWWRAGSPAAALAAVRVEQWIALGLLALHAWFAWRWWRCARAA